MRIRFFHEKDQWTTEGPKINAPENLDRIRACLDDEGQVVVIHHLYRERPLRIGYYSMTTTTSSPG